MSNQWAHNKRYTLSSKKLGRNSNIIANTVESWTTQGLGTLTPAQLKIRIKPLTPPNLNHSRPKESVDSSHRGPQNNIFDAVGKLLLGMRRYCFSICSVLNLQMRNPRVGRASGVEASGYKLTCAVQSPVAQGSFDSHSWER